MRRFLLFFFSSLLFFVGAFVGLAVSPAFASSVVPAPSGLPPLVDANYPSFSCLSAWVPVSLVGASSVVPNVASPVLGVVPGVYECPMANNGAYYADAFAYYDAPSVDVGPGSAWCSSAPFVSYLLAASSLGYGLCATPVGPPIWYVAGFTAGSAVPLISAASGLTGSTVAWANSYPTCGTDPYSGLGLSASIGVDLSDAPGPPSSNCYLNASWNGGVETISLNRPWGGGFDAMLFPVPYSASNPVDSMYLGVAAGTAPKVAADIYGVLAWGAGADVPTSSLSVSADAASATAVLTYCDRLGGSSSVWGYSVSVVWGDGSAASSGVDDCGSLTHVYSSLTGSPFTVSVTWSLSGVTMLTGFAFADFYNVLPPAVGCVACAPGSGAPAAVSWNPSACAPSGFGWVDPVSLVKSLWCLAVQAFSPSGSYISGELGVLEATQPYSQIYGGAQAIGKAISSVSIVPATCISLPAIYPGEAALPCTSTSVPGYLQGLFQFAVGFAGVDLVWRLVVTIFAS